MKADHTFIMQGRNIKALTQKTRADDTFIIQEKRQSKGFRKYDKICPTISKHWGTRGGNVPITNKLRRLTPTECERLQGFPDGWTEGLSDTQRYKCLGNAVTTNVITEIGERILEILK